MPTDQQERDSKLAARRAREKKARERLDDSYVKKLINSRCSDEGPATAHSPDMMEITRAVVFAKRALQGRLSPEVKEAVKVQIGELGLAVNGKARKTG
jgi:hypothetical protein